MKLIPISQYLYDQVMEELNQQDSSKTKGVYEEDVYTPEQRYHILRYLINFLESKQGEIAKEIS
jgi:hypothetical protein